MTNLTLVCLVKIEYVTKSNIFGIKIMIKNGLEKNILKFLHAQANFDREDQSWVCLILVVNGTGHLLGRHSKNSWAEESKTTPFWSEFLWRKYSKDTFSACRLPSSFPAPLHTIRIRKHAWDLAENVIKIKFIYSEKVTKIRRNL